MLSEEAFSEWAASCQLSDAARALLTSVRTSDPARIVQVGRSNVSGYFASRKMGHSAGFESELELGAMWTWDYDDDVLEVWDQPYRVKLNYQLPSGRTGGHWYPVTFCVLHRDGPEFVECKYVKELQQLVASQPYLYAIDANGTYRTPPAERAFERFGVPFRILTDRHLNPKKLRGTTAG